MNSLSEIQSAIAPELDALNRRIHGALDSSNELMNRVVEGYLTTKGKQIRPILVILAARLLGTVNDNVIRAAAAVEMLHNASLIHDDVVDDTDTRRGLPTINAVWDNHIAVLVGDFFVSNSLQQAIDTDDIRVVGTIASLGKLLSLGEIDQIYNARFHRLTEEAYFGVISRKTASLFVACVEIGAYAVGIAADDTRLRALKEFTELLGRCFQIKDDIFDYFSDSRIGKPTGNDLREGKVTLPLLHALDGDDPETRRMNALVQSETLSQEDIEALIEFAKSRGGIDYAYTVMERMRTEAVAILRREFAADNQKANTFIEIFDYIITRDN
ncbi:MAG: polyprenyl synthetase family protein [Candidatus Amulumruptor caecigallinarius]|nr:polyprenyl synthetase family protein [Candidatus Amulumruptor caecigallinarius]MCM1397552.1 polyprenyl synthetase family protein [Candidatus Amulumruptor caecigallinarius]MCM1454454.1 polyprenyl synthetase family protein [bacterium]